MSLPLPGRDALPVQPPRQADQLPQITYPAFTVEVIVTGSQGLGRWLKIRTATAVHVFPMGVEQAIEVGNRLLAPSVQRPG